MHFLMLGRVTSGLSALLALSAGTATAQSYTFTDIGDTGAGGLYQSIYYSTGINASGTTAFLAKTKAGVTGVYTGSGGQPTTIAEGGAGVLTSVQGGGINDSGLVAFQASIAGGANALYTGNGTTNNRVPTDGAYTVSSVNHPSIDAAGTVAYFQNRAYNDQGIYTSSAGASGSTTVAHSTLPSPFTNLYGSPWISTDGTAAYTALLNSDNLGNYSPSGVYAVSGGQTTTIATAGNRAANDFDSVDTKPVVNDAGEVAFIGYPHGGGQGVYTGGGSGLRRVAVQGSAFYVFFAVALNDSGTLVFSASLPTGQKGIFTGSDPQADKVIETGDTLFGSTVTNLFMDAGNLNAYGQIAFVAQLSNGATVLVRANPAPEPSQSAALGLGVLGLGVLVFKARRRRDYFIFGRFERKPDTPGD